MQGTVYDKLRTLREGLAKDVGKFDDNYLSLTMGRLETWHYPKKRKKGMVLSKDEAKIYEYLRSNSLNPSTVYKWFLACKATGDVARALREGTIGLKAALRGTRPFKKLSATEAEFMFHIKSTLQKYVIR